MRFLLFVFLFVLLCFAGSFILLTIEGVKISPTCESNEHEPLINESINAQTAYGEHGNNNKSLFTEPHK